jgi:hypothetical protein
MAETLGSLCDKLTIVKLKQYHSENEERLLSLAQQQKQLISEMDDFLLGAVSRDIPLKKLTFASNKVYKIQAHEIKAIKGSIGSVLSKLAEVNCLLWHEQEKVYEFEKVEVSEKDRVVKQLAILNLERTNCIDKIDTALVKLIEKQTST